MTTFGSALQEWRKELDLSQAEVAAIAGVSQATISRLESQESAPTDVRLISRIARALKRPVADLLPDDSLSRMDAFYAFCPSPLCSRNSYQIEDGQPFVTWSSWGYYPAHEFDETNFCPSCGEALIKECPDCKRRFPREMPSKFCIRCGATIHDRPTDAEWKKIKALLGWEEIPF